MAKEEVWRVRGRPVKYPLPAPIPDTPENIAKAILATPPKKQNEWRHIRERDAQGEESRPVVAEGERHVARLSKDQEEG